MTTPAAQRTVEVHNAWTIHGLEKDGSVAAQPLAEHRRPQDWGDPRWTYQRYRFEWEHDGTRYINHFHGWTDLKREIGEYPRLFAPLVVLILQPGIAPELCGREYLEEEDFWLEAWGPQPPVYEREPDESWEL
jgi:hypothetical protein